MLAMHELAPTPNDRARHTGATGLRHGRRSKQAGCAFDAAASFAVGRRG